MSPGASDEGMRFYLVQHNITSNQLAAIRSKAESGVLLAPGMFCICFQFFSLFCLELIRVEELAIKCNDAKSILAAHLYGLYLKKTTPLKKSLKQQLWG